MKVWGAIAAFAAVTDAQFGRTNMLRFGCNQITIQRLDPLVNPGQAPSTHMHQIIGGNAFNVTMPVADIGKLATCTTCGPSDDMSNYWTANMYFRARNGTFKRVKQKPNRLLFGDRFTNTRSAVTVYYASAGPNTVTAFKPGFRMLTGDANRRASPNAAWRYQSCFRCYTGPNYGGDNAAPCQDARLDTEHLPENACPGGIRTNIHYPTCWDGKNLDSASHQEHVAYPTSGPDKFLSHAACPSTHPVRIPQIMLEVVWDTTEFNDKSLWPEAGSQYKQPFWLSMADNTGYGQHADYVFGWRNDALQKAMDDPSANCMGPTCGKIAQQQPDDADKCTVANMVDEDPDGWVTTLPGQTAITRREWGNVEYPV